MGFEAALGELPLVLFTTLAPSGVVGLILMILPTLLNMNPPQVALKIDRLLFIPLGVTVVGLIASAAHLGNPSNVLYVLLGVGRSPLSNEVAAAVVFLGLAAIYWLSSFTDKPRWGLRKIALVCMVVSGLLFLYEMSVAYDAETVITWSTPFSPLGIWLNGFIGGPLLALVGFSVLLLKDAYGRVRRYDFICWAFACVAAVAASVVYVLQGMLVNTAANSVITAQQLVPHYALMVGAFVLCCVLALVGAFFTMKRLFVLTGCKTRGMIRKCALQCDVNHESGVPQEEASRVTRLIVCAFAGAFLEASLGIFIMRFAFYMMHMTVGISL
jgi:anaerobic dimethyl sulfoxide reductase subunit C (anchor subunit)